MLCSCGSGKESEQVFDARNIYVTRACDDCKEKKLRRYRPEIFTNPRYETDEPIDED